MKPRERAKFNLNELAIEMLEKIPEEIFSSPTTTFLDPAFAGGQFLVEIINKLKTYGHSDENIKSRVFGYEDNIWYVLYGKRNKYLQLANLDVKLYTEFSEDKKLPKFDVVIGNPPYNRGLHLKFLKKAYDISNRHVVLVHPATWLYANRNGERTQKTLLYDPLKKLLSKHLRSLKIVQAKDLGFTIGLYTPLVITHVDKNFSGQSIIENNLEKTSFKGKIERYSPFGDINLIESILKKIDENVDNYLDKHLDKNNGNLFVNLSSIVGNGYLEIKLYNDKIVKFQNRYNLINSSSNMITYKPLTSKSGNRKKFVSFQTHKEAHNFLSFITRNLLCRFLIIYYNHDQNIDGCFKYIPWLDWTNEQTDENIYQKLGLTLEEINLITETVMKKSC